MKPSLFLSLLAVCLLTITACLPAKEQTTDLSTVKADIQALEDAWAAALNAQDLDALMALYTDDAVSMTDDGPMLTGKAAIRKDQEKEFASTPAGRTYAFEALDVYGDGSTVTETGKTTYQNAAGEVTGTGKYMVVWEKQGDTYLCAREIYNNDSPPKPAGSKSLHLFDMPEGVTEAEWSAALAEINQVIAKMGYDGAGYYLYKTEDAEDYRYFFEGVWPSAEAYAKIHENPAWIAASEKLGPLYDQIKAVELYRRMVRVK
jgi:uncharacterized protein (TIGR02246 family)